ncbi:Protein kinase protein rad53 [Saitoella coloradoensis]
MSSLPATQLQTQTETQLPSSIITNGSATDIGPNFEILTLICAASSNNIPNQTITRGIAGSSSGWRAGRHHSCELILQGSRYSGVHFRIIEAPRNVQGPSQPAHASAPIVLIEDLSTNGTFVNLKRLGKGNKCVLAQGDEISLGHGVKEDEIRFIVRLARPSGKEELKGFDSKYTLGEVLGKGSFATVHRALSRSTGQSVAVKVIRKKKFAALPQANVLFRREVEILRQLEHPNVVEYVDYFEDQSTIWLVMEFVPGGDLGELISEQGPFTSDDVWTIIIVKQILEGVQYLHSLGITHRDLKPENILLRENYPHEKPTAKITDFGLAKAISPTAATQATFLQTFCGTLSYLAPEVVAGSSSYTPAVDLWSVGCVVWVILTGTPPFMGTTHAEVSDKILNGRIDWEALGGHGVREDAVAFLRGLLQIDVKERMTLSQALDHPWLGGSGEDAFVKEESAFRPPSRPGIQRLKTEIVSDLFAKPEEFIHDPETSPAKAETPYISRLRGKRPASPPLPEDSLVPYRSEFDDLLPSRRSDGPEPPRATPSPSPPSRRTTVAAKSVASDDPKSFVVLASQASIASDLRAGAVPPPSPASTTLAKSAALHSVTNTNMAPRPNVPMPSCMDMDPPRSLSKPPTIPREGSTKENAVPWATLHPLPTSLPHDSISITQSQIVLGRNPEMCDVVIPDVRLSKRHCVIWRVKSESGKWSVFVRDLSVNGCSIQGKRKLKKGKTMELEGDDGLVLFRDREEMMGFRLQLLHEDALREEDDVKEEEAVHEATQRMRESRISPLKRAVSDFDNDDTTKIESPLKRTRSSLSSAAAMPAPRKPWARLLSLNPKSCPSFALIEDELQIGRKDIAGDIRISSHHCRLKRDLGTGGVKLIDSSLNGSWVNGELIRNRKERAIEEKDELVLIYGQEDGRSDAKDKEGRSVEIGWVFVYV